MRNTSKVHRLQMVSMKEFFDRPALITIGSYHFQADQGVTRLPAFYDRIAIKKRVVDFLFDFLENIL